jgi:hypothetical protein
MVGQWEVRMIAVDSAGERAHESYRFFVR